MRALAPVVGPLLALGLTVACAGDTSTPPASAEPDAAEAPADAADATPDAGPAEPDVPVGDPYPEPGAWGPNTGPGGPTRTFTADELHLNCAYLDGGPDDTVDHHNLVVMYDGFLLMPWSPESGTGGLTFFDISDPCEPTVAGYGYDEKMRETHAIGFSHIGGAWAVTNAIHSFFDGGILFWDLSDITTPTAVARLDVEGFFYPDAYARVTLSVFWQAPYVYVAGADNGVYVVDATDPTQPEVVHQYVFDPVLRAGQVVAVGNLLVVTAAEGVRTVLLDISQPDLPQPLPGGDFVTANPDGLALESYFSNVTGGYIWYAQKDNGGGLYVFDIHDPSKPSWAGGYISGGNGGYIFVQDEFAFVGESSFAGIYDVSDLGNIQPIAQQDLEGDLDTATPIGNVVVLSVDDKAIEDQATAVAPWTLEPDTRAPRVTWAWPPDGATDLALTSRLGLTFNEFVDVKSAWEGSVRVYEAGTDPALTRIDGHISVQEAVVSFWPVEPLAPGTTYTLEVPAGGIVDYNGNPIVEPFSRTFSTVGP